MFRYCCHLHHFRCNGAQASQASLLHFFFPQSCLLHFSPFSLSLSLSLSHTHTHTHTHTISPPVSLPFAKVLVSECYLQCSNIICMLAILACLAILGNPTSLLSFLHNDSNPTYLFPFCIVTMVPASHGEAFNVLRYEHNQHYDSHMDTFDPKVSHGWPASCLKKRTELEAPKPGLHLLET